MNPRTYLYNEVSGIYTLSVHDNDINSEPVIVYSNVRKQNKFIKYNNRAMRYVYLPWGTLLKKLTQGTFYYYNINDTRLSEIKKVAPHVVVKRNVTVLPCKNYKNLIDV